MKKKVLIPLATVAITALVPMTASAQYDFPPVTIDYPEGVCVGITYNPSDLGAIRPDSAWDLAAIEDDYQRCVIGDALYRAGVLPAAPVGYAWTWDYALAPESY